MRYNTDIISNIQVDMGLIFYYTTCYFTLLNKNITTLQAVQNSIVNAMYNEHCAAPEHLSP